MASVPPSTSGHPDMDYAEHERTYAMFTGMMKWGTIGCIGIMVLLAWTTL